MQVPKSLTETPPNMWQLKIEDNNYVGLAFGDVVKMAWLAEKNKGWTIEKIEKELMIQTCNRVPSYCSGVEMPPTKKRSGCGGCFGAFKII